MDVVVVEKREIWDVKDEKEQNKEIGQMSKVPLKRRRLTRYDALLPEPDSPSNSER